MVIESVKQFDGKQALIEALKIITLGEKDRLQGKGISGAVAGGASKPKIMSAIIFPDAQDDLRWLQEYMLDKWGEAS
jgi:hypothetical protein